MPLGKFLWTSIGVVASGIFSLILMIATAVERVLHPVANRVLWIMHTSLAGVTCGSTLGLTLGMKSWQGIISWVPCLIMAAFSGLEAIYTKW